MRFAAWSGVVVIVFALPFIATAQTAQTSCPAPARTLSQGVKGPDVLALQQFLINDGDLLSDDATGYFGPLTAAAVGEWQLSAGVISSSDDPGFGTVGPKSRAALTTLCASSSINTGSWATNGSGASSGGNPAPSQQNSGTCPLVPEPAATCGSGWRGVRNASGCVASWYCVGVANSSSASAPAASSYSTPVSTGSEPPVITNFTGPSSLGLDQWGTWNVSASDPSGGTLSYTYEWGDSEDSVFDQIQEFAQVADPDPTGTHAYDSPGVYQVTVIAQNAGGSTTQTSSSVVVEGAASASSSAYVFNTGANTGTGATTGTSTISSSSFASGSCTYGSGNYTSGVILGPSDCPANAAVASTTPSCTSQLILCSGGTWIYDGAPSSSSGQGGTTYGSSGSGNVGQLCAVSGQTSFVACPYMANCPGGGTYLSCQNGVWVELQSSANDRLSNVASVLTAIETTLASLGK